MKLPLELKEVGKPSYHSPFTLILMLFYFVINFYVKSWTIMEWIEAKLCPCLFFNKFNTFFTIKKKNLNVQFEMGFFHGMI